MVNHIDDSKERPETAISDDSRNKGKTPSEAMADKGIGSGIQNKKRKHRRDPKHTRLNSATNRAADKGDAER
ncbi:MAG: hypothetical protein F4Y44_03325 [Chloroflexi bacterium]|nr:hypothetical protein [Chloroflexota bacterium]